MQYIFTAHAEYRIKKRKLTKEEVIEAIKCPDKTLKKYGKYYAQKNIGRGTIEVVYEKTKKVYKDGNSILVVKWK